MAVEIGQELEKRLMEETTIWLTTVSPDGTPQPKPVWFLWTDGTFLIFSQPQAKALRNIRQNPKVALTCRHTDEYGEEGLVVIVGEARVDPQAPPSNHLAAYRDKYRRGLEDISMTLESAAKEFSVAIRVTPTRVVHGN